MMVKIPIVVLALAVAAAAIEAAITIDQVRDAAKKRVDDRRDRLKSDARILDASSATSLIIREECVVHQIRQYGVALSALRFRALERFLLAVVNLIQTRFDNRSPKAMQGAFARGKEPIEKYTLMLIRAELRGLTEGTRISRVIMSLLLLTLRDNQHMRSYIEGPARIDLDFLINGHGKKTESTSVRLYKTLDQALRSNQVNYDITDTIDREIDQQISYLEPPVLEPELYYTYPVLTNGFVARWIEHELESTIGFNMTMCEGVREFEHSEVDAVIQEQIDALRQKVPIRIW